MSIRIVVDGYNLARTEPGAGALALEEQRERLIRKLAAYRRVRGSDVTVVFDAAAGTSAGGTRAPRGGVSVLFTAIGETADQRIEKLTRAAAPGCVVVTSDRFLGDLVRRRGIETLDSASFLARMEQASLMEVKGGFREEDDAGPRRTDTEKRGPSRRLKKRERLREKLKSKL